MSDAAAPEILPDRFLNFDPEDWATRTGSETLTLTETDLGRLASLGDHIDLDEVERIYLPVSRLLSSHVEAMQALFAERAQFLGVDRPGTPFVLGIAGSVAVGKSTTARVIAELMRRWPSSPQVELVTTDGFLLPNAELEARGIMHRKGFPESYDRARMLAFLSDIKGGVARVEAPVYSHLVYDIVPDESIVVSRPDILIFEGLNVLQSPGSGTSTVHASDFFDFSIYVDAARGQIEDWYVDRFMKLRRTAFADPGSFFHRFTELDDAAARAKAEEIWTSINLVNLEENILPTRMRASLILRKGGDHKVERISLRRL